PILHSPQGKELRSSMAAAGPSSPLIESRSDLVEALARGCKPEEAFRVGTEHEKFTFFRDSFKPVPYEGENGIGALLGHVQAETAWEPVFDRDKVIGLTNPKGGWAISLEPGGQFELSGAPLETIHQTCVEAGDHLRMLKKFTEPMGIEFLGLGVAPTWSLDEI